jgi:hypothetical protein
MSGDLADCSRPENMRRSDKLAACRTSWEESCMSFLTTP